MGCTGFVTKRQLPTGDRRQKRIVQNARVRGVIRTRHLPNRTLKQTIEYITACIDVAQGYLPTAEWIFDPVVDRIVVRYEFKADL